MRNRDRKTVVTTRMILGIAVLIGVVSARPAAADPKGELLETVLRHVPADATGCLVVRQVEKAAGAVEALVAAVKPNMPGPQGEPQPVPVPPVLMGMKMEFGLGEGFDSTGGFAAVALDPKKYPTPPSRAAKEEGVPDIDLTVVLLVPGRGVHATLPKFGWDEDDSQPGLFFAEMDEGTMYARQAGKVVAMSRSRKGMEAVVAPEKSVVETFSGAEREFVLRNHVAAWGRMALLDTVKEAMLKAAATETVQKMEQDDAGNPRMTKTSQKKPVPAEIQSMALSIEQLKAQLGENATACLGARFGAEGLKMEARLTPQPDSLIGKALAGTKLPDAPLLGRIANQPYAMAFGMFQTPKMTREQAARQVDIMLAGEQMKSIPEATRRQYKKLMLDLHEQLIGIQGFVAPADGDEGVLGIAAVMDCESADRMMELIKESIPVANEMCKHSDLDVYKGMSLTHNAAAGRVGGNAYDAVTVSLKQLAEADEDARKVMKTLLGSETITVRVMKFSDTAVVASVGGGEAFLAKAARSVGADAALADNPHVVKALKDLPENRFAVGLLDLPTTWDIVKKALAANGLDDLPPLKLTSHVPMVGVGWIDGSDIGLLADLPAEPLREGVQAAVDGVSYMMMKAMREAMENQGGGPNDF